MVQRNRVPSCPSYEQVSVAAIGVGLGQLCCTLIVFLKYTPRSSEIDATMSKSSHGLNAISP